MQIINTINVALDRSPIAKATIVSWARYEAKFRTFALCTHPLIGFIIIGFGTKPGTAAAEHQWSCKPLGGDCTYKYVEGAFSKSVGIDSSVQEIHIFVRPFSNFSISLNCSIGLLSLSRIFFGKSRVIWKRCNSLSVEFFFHILVASRAQACLWDMIHT